MHTFPAVWLRLEGLVVLIASLLLYAQHGRGWLLFAALFLAPDLSMLGYVRGPIVGAATYNAAHTYAVSLTLAILGLLLGQPVLVALSLIWSAHIGFDRALGYGLKLRSGFQDTHLGRIGRTHRPNGSPGDGGVRG